MKMKWIDAYMDVAARFAELSTAQRLKVGAVIVKDHRIISIGYNGTPAGWDNECEYRQYIASPNSLGEYRNEDGSSYNLITKDEVIHAEANAIIKLARDGESGQGSILFCTHAPCMQCSKLIYGAGVGQVYYKNDWQSSMGTQFLSKSGVVVIKHDHSI